ncbi:hypothetical protein SSX86_015769 [Deinandra increscens subsp. villosa]|uniref:Late embryogenesis abundant protein LEA-2 subgroup domain-containing protein n=1 Tax=Deinandra increscens subsp. villosa TaxID=3103831 RepID=A0AAP0D1H4_9ASTR
MAHDEKHTVIATTHDVPDHNHNHNKPSPSRDAHRKIATTIVILLLLAAITALTLYLLYHPHHPKFTVVAAAVYTANEKPNTTSSSPPPPAITAMQLTIVTRNPNTRVSIYYDHLMAYLISHGYQPITPPVMLPPLSHERDSTVAFSPVWPVSPAVVNGLVSVSGDDGVGGGAVSLRVVLTGRLRWKGGSMMRSRRKRVHVGCDVLVGLKRGVVSGRVPLVGPSVCRVDV